MTEDCYQPIKQVAVFGRGIEAWSAAATLASRFKQLEVVLVDHGPQQNLLPLENCWPSVFQIHQWLGISESQLMNETRSGFSLGTRYSQWPISNDIREEEPHHSGEFFTPFSPFGFNLKGIDFFNYLIRAKQQQLRIKLAPGSYSLSAVAAENGKFRPPSQNRASVFSTLEYAYNLDIAGYQQLIQARAKNLGIKVVNANECQVNPFAKESGIKSVICNESASGKQMVVKADLYVDCTGQEGTLVKVIDKEGDGKAAERLQFRYTVDNEGSSAPYHSLTARSLGWSSQVAADICSGVYVVDRDDLGIEQIGQQVSEELEASLGKPLISFKPEKIAVQQRTSWVGNCVAMGDARVSLEPLYIPKLHLFHQSLIRLVETFPANGQAMSVVAAHYNRMEQRELEFVEEFNLLHRMSLKGELAPRFWQLAGETPAHLKTGERLHHRLSLFQSRGKHAFYEGDLISSHAWKGFLLNNGVWPQFYDPLTDMVNPIWIMQQLNKIHDTFVQAVTSMPGHSDYIASIQQGNVNAKL